MFAVLASEVLPSGGNVTLRFIFSVIPAQAGIHQILFSMGPCFKRGDDAAHRQFVAARVPIFGCVAATGCA